MWRRSRNVCVNQEVERVYLKWLTRKKYFVFVDSWWPKWRKNLNHQHFCHYTSLAAQVAACGRQYSKVVGVFRADCIAVKFAHFHYFVLKLMSRSEPPHRLITGLNETSWHKFYFFFEATQLSLLVLFCHWGCHVVFFSQIPVPRWVKHILWQETHNLTSAHF